MSVECVLFFFPYSLSFLSAVVLFSLRRRPSFSFSCYSFSLLFLFLVHFDWIACFCWPSKSSLLRRVLSYNPRQDVTSWRQGCFRSRRRRRWHSTWLMVSNWTTCRLFRELNVDVDVVALLAMMFLRKWVVAATGKYWLGQTDEGCR